MGHYRKLVYHSWKIQLNHWNAGIHKKILGAESLSDLAQQTTTFIISDKEVNDIKKIVKFLEESGLLKKDVSEIIENKAKEQISYYVIRCVRW